MATELLQFLGSVAMYFTILIAVVFVFLWLANWRRPPSDG